ncbi:MAG TPA: aspartyl protease family protein [Pyrinomonadaceae bacterium]|nr:aspartyl protease family protein [Pyrinomonadaceae bacterium]
MTLKPANYKYRRTNGTSLTGGKEMGYIYAELELTNEDDLAYYRRGDLPCEKIQKVTCRALVDSGAWDLVINQDVQSRLNLPFIGREAVSLADETWLDVDIVGPVNVRFEDHFTIVRAVILPGISEVLLGAYPLQGLDAFIDAKGERLLVHPDSPYNPKSYIRQVKQISLSV